MGRMKLACLLALLLVAPSANAEEDAALRQDASELSRLLRTEHVDPFWLRGERSFKQAERALLEAARSETRREFVLTGMLRLLAVIGDGHTVMASGDRYRRLGFTPFFAEIYDDGVFLVRVPSAVGELRGAQVLQVGGVPIEAALDRLRGVVPHATESRFRRWAPAYLHLPGLLFGLGLSDNPDQVTLTVALQNGARQVHRFEHVTDAEYEALEMVSIEFPSTRRTREPEARYRFEPIENSDAVYFSFRRVASADDGESIWTFGRRLATHLREARTRRLIIDLRDNGGGGYQFSAHLRPLLRQVPSLDHPGGIVVLTGPKTYSAASDFLAQLELFTDATLIGLPPAGRNGEPGDDDDFVLPKSGITVRISQVAAHAASEVDARSVIGVDQLVPDNFADRLAGRDPALDAAIEFEPPLATDIPAPSSWLGRYAFSADADLVIRESNGRLRATVPPRMDTPLTPLGPARMAASFPGLTLLSEPGKDGIRLMLADGTSRFLHRRANPAPGAWELAYRGDFEAAEVLFRQALKANPNSPTVTDGTFTSEAIHRYYELLGSEGPVVAREHARNLLELAIRLLPDAPNSEYSLRFYAPAD